MGLLWFQGFFDIFVFPNVYSIRRIIFFEQLIFAIEKNHLHFFLQLKKIANDNFYLKILIVNNIFSSNVQI
jgi:hypothetical protein